MKKIACQLVKSIMQIKQMSLSVSCHLMILVCQNIFYRIGSKKFKLFEWMDLISIIFTKCPALAVEY